MDLNIPIPKTRLRRLRRVPMMREWVAEHRLSCRDLILPLFVKAGRQVRQPIASMLGHFQWSVDQLSIIIDEVLALGIPGVILFGIPDEKDPEGLSASVPDGVVQQAVRFIKKRAPELLVITDLCFCEYTSHGHCGLLSKHHHHEVDNDLTLKALGLQALSHAEAGADVIAPSGMMDGAVAAIRAALDQNRFTEIPILSYAVKYASALYGPFREAAEGAPQWGDRRGYQMNPANGCEALREAALDVAEGADLLMVKPAGWYSDIISQVKAAYPGIPLGAYQVSGEYAMIKAAHQSGWLNETDAMVESLLSLKRAGSDFIITYFAQDCAQWLREQNRG